MVNEANNSDIRKSSRPTTSKSVRSTRSAKSAKSVVIAEEVTEIQIEPNIVTKSLTKLS